MIDNSALDKSNRYITVVGVGQRGCQILNYIIERGLEGVDTLAIDTDSYTLLQSKASRKFLIGDDLTRGRGTLGNKDLGQMAAEEDSEELEKIFSGSALVFATAGLGGGTGSGALPTIMSIAKKAGAMTITAVTMPQRFEGKSRIKVAESAIHHIEQNTNALVCTSNDELVTELPVEKFGDWFSDTFYHGVVGLSDLIQIPGIINLDMADVQAIFSEAKSASIGFGSASDENRPISAIESALSNSLGTLNLNSAQGVLFNVAGGSNMTLFEVNEVAKYVRERSHPDVNMIFGAVVDPKLKDTIQVTIFTANTRINSAENDQVFLNSNLAGMSLTGKMEHPKRLKVFLCHSSGDKPVVRKLYQRLYARKGIEPWIDEANLLPGENWNYAIEKAVKESDVVIVCISHTSVSKEGYVQKEIRRALDIAYEKPDDTIFMIPLRIDDCAVPEKLSSWQWVNYYEEGAFNKLIKSLQKRADTLGIKLD